MTGLQNLRLVAVALVAATMQTAVFERFLLVGVGSVVVPVWLVVVVGRRLPATNAAVAGFGVGLAWDALSVSLFGRYGLALAAIAALAGGVARFADAPRRRARFLRRTVVLMAATVWLWSFSALVGETLPPVSWSTVGGLVLASSVGAVVTGPGGRLERFAIRGRTAWDAPDRSTSWVDRRAGLFPVPGRSDAEPEAA